MLESLMLNLCPIVWSSLLLTHVSVVFGLGS